MYTRTGWLPHAAVLYSTNARCQRPFPYSHHIKLDEAADSIGYVDFLQDRSTAGVLRCHDPVLLWLVMKGCYILPVDGMCAS